MNMLKRYLAHIFIDGLSGMALGLFATLIIGTILNQIGVLIGGTFGQYIVLIASVAKCLTGAGIAIGVGYKFHSSPLTAASAAVAGMVGAFASSILSGTINASGAITLAGPGEPLGAFLASFVALELGGLVSGKTKLDILITPVTAIASGSVVGLLLGPPISSLMTALGDLINWGVVQQPILMGIIVSVVMGMCLTLPISSAALGIILGLSGTAAGAAVAGCAAQMVGFAVISYRENKLGGLIAQGIGTSMLQMANIVRNPLIWVPAILASAITGPISSKVLGMTCGATGCGMGTSGLVGQIITWQTMIADGFAPGVVLAEIAAVHFILPAVLALLFATFMRRKGWIKENDLKLDLD
ncbi:MAG: PTS sugar transporter subunit IIC [Firmicutes bacterium]|nr:PTS sugar transporter subunit IIC [Bacillota bacterium]